jgi:hypothetical protein
MTATERAALAWATMWVVALACAYVLTYLQPDRNRVTKSVTWWSSRDFGRFAVVGRPNVLILAIMFTLMAIAGTVMTVLGIKF